jgi:protein SCO1/2
MFRLLAIIVVFSLQTWHAISCAVADSTTVPKAAQAIGIDQNIGDELPLSLEFINERDEIVALSKIIDGKVPVFLTLNYSNCPGLCVAQLNNLVKTVNGLDSSKMQLGRDFRMISISIDPTETAERLADTKDRYCGLLDGEHSPDGWYFLRGSSDAIRSVAEKTGFRYTYDSKTNQFNHAAVAIGVSPKGVITRYLYDLALEPATLRLALVETSQGKLGSIGDQLLLWCYHFDPDENRYSASARRLMSIGGGLFVIVGLAISIPFWLSHRGKAAATEDIGSATK